VLVTRLIIQPALLTGLVVAALALGVFTAPDPMFLLALLLSNATPTAINMQASVWGGAMGCFAVAACRWVGGNKQAGCGGVASF
jgi:hypothetical protein